MESFRLSTNNLFLTVLDFYVVISTVLHSTVQYTKYTKLQYIESITEQNIKLENSTVLLNCSFCYQLLGMNKIIYFQIGYILHTLIYFYVLWWRSAGKTYNSIKIILFIVYIPFMGIYLKKCKKKILSKSNKYVGLHSSIFMHADNFRTIDIYFLLHHQTWR